MGESTETKKVPRLHITFRDDSNITVRHPKKSGGSVICSDCGLGVPSAVVGRMGRLVCWPCHYDLKGGR